MKNIPQATAADIVQQGRTDCLAGVAWWLNPYGTAGTVTGGAKAWAWDSGHSEMRAALRRAGHLVCAEAFAGFAPAADIKESGQ